MRSQGDRPRKGRTITVSLDYDCREMMETLLRLYQGWRPDTTWNASKIVRRAIRAIHGWDVLGKTPHRLDQSM